MIAGLAWIALASVFLGTFALPGKYVKNYAWENTWGAFFFLGMLVVPVGFASLTINGLGETYARVPWGVLLGVMALGFLWGCGFCLWGYGLSMLGLSLGYAITMGTMALCGSMLPFFLGQGNRVGTTGGMVVIAGILVCVAGVACSGVAGLRREQSQRGTAAQTSDKRRSLTGAAVCVLAGLLSSGCNIAFYVGSQIGKIDSISVASFGNPAWMGGLSVWVLIFLGGLVPSLTFSTIQLSRNGTWGRFLQEGSGRNLVLAALMALGHFACLFFYGLGGWMVGALGTSVGFAIFQCGSVLVGNGLGYMTGEWRDASRNSKAWLAGGLAVLVTGIIVVSFGNTIP